MLSDTVIGDRMSHTRRGTVQPSDFAYAYAIMTPGTDPTTGTMHAPSDKEATLTVREYAIRFLRLSPTGLKVTVDRQPEDDDQPLSPV